jgi:hypothetical protein
MAEPSFLTGAAEKPDSLVSSSNERSEVSQFHKSLYALRRNGRTRGQTKHLSREGVL